VTDGRRAPTSWPRRSWLSGSSSWMPLGVTRPQRSPSTANRKRSRLSTRRIRLVKASAARIRPCRASRSASTHEIDGQGATLRRKPASNSAMRPGTRVRQRVLENKLTPSSGTCTTSPSPSNSTEDRSPATVRRTSKPSSTSSIPSYDGSCHSFLAPPDRPKATTRTSARRRACSQLRGERLAPKPGSRWSRLAGPVPSPVSAGRGRRSPDRACGASRHLRAASSTPLAEGSCRAGLAAGGEELVTAVRNPLGLASVRPAQAAGATVHFVEIRSRHPADGVTHDVPYPATWPAKPPPQAPNRLNRRGPDRRLLSPPAGLGPHSGDGRYPIRETTSRGTSED
jgi:hypothetical protein